MRLLILISIVVVVAGSMAASLSAAGDEVPNFTADVIILSEGVNYGIFSMPKPATLVFADISTHDATSALIISGPTQLWLYRDGKVFIGEGPDGTSRVFPAGTYHVYLVSTPASPISASLRFEGLSGAASYRLEGTSEAHIGRLDPGMIETPVARFHGFQPFDGEAYSGFFVYEDGFGPFASIREWRWSTEDGIIFCYGNSSQGIGGGGWIRRTGLLWAGGHGRPVDLTYFRQHLALVSVERVLGIWVQRAPTDSPVFNATPVRVPHWSFTYGDPLLDQDAACAHHLVGQLLHFAENAELRTGFALK